jgi:hypothetical protein
VWRWFLTPDDFQISAYSTEMGADSLFEPTVGSNRFAVPNSIMGSKMGKTSPSRNVSCLFPPQGISSRKNFGKACYTFPKSQHYVLKGMDMNTTVQNLSRRWFGGNEARSRPLKFKINQWKTLTQAILIAAVPR